MGYVILDLTIGLRTWTITDSVERAPEIFLVDIAAAAFVPRLGAPADLLDDGISSAFDIGPRTETSASPRNRSRWVSDMMAEHNALHGIGFKLNYNIHDCTSDHRPFWDHGYTAVMTHSESHGPAHSSGDTRTRYRPHMPR